VPESEETPPPVRQRNTTPYTYNVAETEHHPACAVLPGDEATFPALLDGWTAVDAPEAQAETPKSTRKRTAAADTDTKDGGESR
jgi:hypothetical protein